MFDSNSGLPPGPRQPQPVGPCGGGRPGVVPDLDPDRADFFAPRRRADPAFQAAGAFLANQPPSRRYVSLGIGGNLFGVLLNLGGLGLLIEMTLAGQRRLETVSAVSPAVHDVRERRIVTAIVPGLCHHRLLVALRHRPEGTLLLIFTEVHWRDAAPWGLGFAALFLIVGGVMDIVERRLFPVFPKPVAVPPAPGDGLGLLAVLGHLVGLALLVIGGDHLLPYSFQEVLVGVVPVYAVIWSMVRHGTRGPARLIGDFTANAPRYVNEIGVFALAGLIGALLVALVPQHALDPVLEAVVDLGGPVALALALAWVTLLAAMLGLHPIISVVILAEFMVRTPLISQQAALLSLLTGWTLTVCLAPLATTATYVSAISRPQPGDGQPAVERPVRADHAGAGVGHPHSGHRRALVLKLPPARAALQGGTRGQSDR